MGGEVNQARDAGVDLVLLRVTPPGCAGGSSKGCSPPPPPSTFSLCRGRPSGWELWMLPVEPVPTGCGRGADSTCSRAGQAVPLTLAV